MKSKKGPVIAICGAHGVGKTTVAKLVAQELNLRYISAGQIFRRLAKEYNMDLQKFSKFAEENFKIDREIDNKILEEAKKGGVVLDGRITAWIAKDYTDLKVLLIAPLEVRVSRIAKRDGISFEEALKETREREDSEVKRYEELYKINPDDFMIFDLIINTLNFNQGSCVKLIKAAVEEILSSSSSE